MGPSGMSTLKAALLPKAWPDMLVLSSSHLVESRCGAVGRRPNISVVRLFRLAVP